MSTSAPPPEPGDDGDVPAYESLTAGDRRRVDRTAEEFRRALARDPRARPEPFTHGFEGPALRVLQRELLLELWDFGRRAADRQLAAAARDLFPDAGRLVARVLGERTAIHGCPPKPSDEPFRLDGYDLLNRISDRGAFAVVYRAYDRSVRRDVAVKVLRPEHLTDPDAVERFRDEAALQAELHDAGVPAVSHVGFADNGCPYIAMDLVEGDTLRGRLPSGRLSGPFGDADAAVVALLGRVARAVAPAHAHPRVICHLDLSPNNVMVGGGKPEVVILDWGLGRHTGTARPVGGGTPGYAAPEKLQRDPSRWDPALLTPRTDVFSLGCFLAHALVGELPVPPDPAADDAGQTAFRAWHADVSRSLAGARDARRLPTELVSLTAECLALDPSRRPPNAGAVAQRIETYFTAAEAERQEARVRDARRQAARRRNWALAAVVAGSLAGWVWYDGETAKARRAAATAAATKTLGEGDALAAAGKWYEALARFRAVLAEPNWSEDERFRVRLRVLRAVTFLGDREGAKAELAGLLAHPLADRFHGRLAFEQAIQLLGQSMAHAATVAVAGEGLAAPAPTDAEALRLLAVARDDTAVPEPDRATARALLALNARTALEHYEEAVRAEPFHPYAGPYMLVTQLLSGRLADALARAEAWAAASPADPLPWFYKAFILTLQRRPTDADAALARLARAGGGRALPLDTLRLCTSAIRVTRAVDDWLPRMAVAESELEGVLKGLAFVAELAEFRQPGGGFKELVLFALPLAPAPRRAVGNVLAAAVRVRSEPSACVGLLTGTDGFVAAGMVEFVRGMALAWQSTTIGHFPSRLAVLDTAVGAFQACITSSDQLWDVRAVAEMCLAQHRLSAAQHPAFAADAERFRREGRNHLLHAAGRPGLSADVKDKIRRIAALTGDDAFLKDLDQEMARPK